MINFDLFFFRLIGNQYIQKYIKDCQIEIARLNERTNHLSLPKSSNPEIVELMNQRNIRIKVIGNILQFLHELADKKVTYELKVQTSGIKTIMDNLKTGKIIFLN